MVAAVIWLGLLTPSEAAPPTPRYTELASQSGHVLLGLLTWALADRWGASPSGASLATLGVWGGWETLQWVLAGRGWRLLRGALADGASYAVGALWAWALVGDGVLAVALVATAAALGWAVSRVE